MAKKARYKKHKIELPKSGEISLYASPKHTTAIQQLREMPVFEGIKMLDLMDEFYRQGQKDGRKDVIEQIQHKVVATVNYLPPGQPKKKRKS